jgi:predicted ArsR family transcriptional regulator
MANNWWEEAPLAEQKSDEWWQAAPLAKAAEKEERPEDQSILRSVADIPLKGVSGAVTGVRLIADAFGAGNEVSNTLKGAEDWVGALYSAQSKKDSKEVARIMKDAEDKGMGEQVAAAIKAFSVAPVDLVSNALGTSAPAIIAGLGATLFGAPVLVGTGIAAGVGSTMGAGTVKGSIYDAVKEELAKTDMPPEQVEARAKLAQDYDGQNLGLILTGAALGGIGATTGFEPAAARQLAKQIATKGAKAEAVAIAAKEATEEAAKRGVIKQGAVTGAKEFAGEAAEAGQEQAAQNIALQREGFDVPTMRGVVGAATLEGMAGLGLGAVGGGREAARARKELELEKAAATIDAVNRGTTTTVRPPAAEGEAPTVETVPAGQPDPERVAQLATVFKEMKLSNPEEAAIEQATVEAVEDQEYASAQREAQGAATAVGPVVEPSGVGAGVAAQPGTEPAPGGVGVPEPTGMVSAGPDVGEPVAREAAEPAALTPLETAIAEADKIATEQFQPVEEAIAELQTPEAAPVAEEAVPEAVPVAEEVAPEAALEIAPDATTQEIAEQVEVTPEVAKTVADIEAASTAVVTPEAPKKGRGRPALTEEQRIANRAATKAAYRNKGKAAAAVSSTTDTAIEALNTALAPIDEAKIETDEQLSEAETNKRVDKVKAIKALLTLQESLPATDTARGRITAALKNSAISAKEIADVRTGMAYEKSKVSRSEKGGKADQPDEGFSKATTGTQALARVIKTGDAFQKFIAQRLRGFVKDVEFIVIEKGDPVPEQLRRNMNDWNAARGLFIEDLPAKTRRVYVRGASFGADQGVNNITVLHELLHAATNQKLSLGLAAIANKFSPDALLTRATRAFTRVMMNASDAYETMDAAGKVPDDLRALVESTLDIDENGKPYFKIFELHQEFLAYGMTEPVMQKFLMTVDATQAKGSAFNRFVRAMMEFFGVGEKDFSAMTDLVLITDKILTAQKTPTMQKLERIERGESYEQVFASAKQTRAKVDKTVEKLEKSTFADSIKSGGTIEQLVGMRNMEQFLDVLTDSKVWLKDNVMQQLLPALQTEALVRWAGKLGIGGIKETWAGINKMNAMRNKAKNAIFETAEDLNNLAAKDAKQYIALGNVMHYSTITSKDPNKVTIDRNLTELWGRLTPENKKLYNKVREFYADNHKAYHAVLEEQIEASGLPGSASDPKSPKGKLIASIKQMYEDGTKLYPYFPLMRYGQYWVRVGKGKAREFHMFESQFDRDNFVKDRVEQLNAETGNTRTKAEMMGGGDIDEGNDLSSARKNDVAASEMLKEIFNTLEAKPVTSVTDDFGNVVGSTATLNMDKLKDDIYQMYLQTLPDRNFRRQFMHRQGVAGFSGDIHRNFVATGTNMANQIARIKYGPEVMRSLETATASLEGNPDKARLGDFVSEMRLRAEEQVRPSSEDSLGFQVSNLANTTAFLWMMTSIKTVVAQFTAVPIFVAPVLASKHGTVKTAAALAKSLNVFNGVGVTKTNPDGSTSYTMPSMSQLKGLTADEKLATQYMQDFGISDTTMAFDLGNRRDVPTKLGQSKARRIAKATTNTMTALFHHSERMIREVTFMTSYRLNREKLGDIPGAHESALEAATQESHEALGNYHASNRPRGLAASKSREVLINASSPVGRSLLQFKMFPAFVTTYFIRNAYNMFKGLTPEDRKQAKVQLLGSLGMSYALAGYVGIPGISMAMGVLQGLLNARKDDDEDDPLEGRDLEFWFRNVWLPQTFGNVKVGGHTLDEFLDKGLITGLTGYDITSSMSMNNMWFPDVKEQATAQAEVIDYGVSLLGPSASLVKQAAKGVDYFSQGKILQGMEQWAPALFRAPLTAVRYSREGAQTTTGASIKDAEEFTIGQLMAQSAGFATEGLQARREAIFKIQGLMLEAKRERSDSLARLDLEITKGSDDAVEKAIDKIIKYNSKNYWDPITSDQISQSTKKRMERRLMSDRGFPIDKKYYPQVMDLLEPSSKKLEREVSK